MLFAVYVFLFLYKGFGEQLEVFGNVYARLFPLRISFTPWAIALVATLVLCSIQHLTRTCFNLGFRLLFVSYLPALVGLFLFIDLDGDDLESRKIFLQHGVIAGILLLLCLVRIGKYMLSNNESYNSNRSTVSIPSWTIGTLLFFCISFFLIGLFSPMKISARNEIAMLRAIQSNNYNLVLQIDSSNPKPTLKMTQLRNYALLLKGELGNQLFHYPQYYGEQGIDTSFIYRNKAAGARVPASSELQKCDIKLSEALLEKDLERFISNLDDYTSYYATERLPRHYQEAYAMYVYLHPDKPYAIANDELRNSFIHYLNIRNREAGNRERQRADVKKSPYYGTYWWYYDFIDVPQNNKEK